MCPGTSELVGQHPPPISRLASENGDCQRRTNRNRDGAGGVILIIWSIQQAATGLQQLGKTSGKPFAPLLAETTKKRGDRASPQEFSLASFLLPLKIFGSHNSLQF